ncbi:hypothetical protein VF02_31090 [Nostoc linckia z1]|nr:hypothetical protein VF02_31090 [Nostoc linckia z1]
MIRIELLYTSIFPREKRLEEVKKIKLEFCYPLAIKRLLPDLSSDQQVLEVLEIVESCITDDTDDIEKAKSLGIISPKLSTECLKKKALNIAREQINDKNKNLAFCGLYPYLNTEEKWKVDRNLNIDDKGEVDDDLNKNQNNDWKDKIIAISQHLEPDKLYNLWKKGLHILATNNRNRLLLNLGDLSPVIFQLGGDKAIIQVLETIEEVEKQFGEQA